MIIVRLGHLKGDAIANNPFTEDIYVYMDAALDLLGYAAKINSSKVLFLDIETVPLQEHFNQLDAEAQALWEHKSAYQRGEATPEDFYERAGIWAEFGKIVCISVGFFTPNTQDVQFRTKSF